MIKVNVIYDNILDDADIIAVSDEIASNIEKLGQVFLRWVTSTEAALEPEYYRFTNENGETSVVAETVGFIKWLNERYSPQDEPAYIITANTNYQEGLLNIEF